MYEKYKHYQNFLAINVRKVQKCIYAKPVFVRFVQPNVQKVLTLL
jgi:hypothetical protein